MSSIGYVLYKKTDQPGVLDAVWTHSEDGSGTGIATGRPSDTFAGVYRVRYLDEDGGFSAERDLEIRQEGPHYLLTWSQDDKVTAIGIGMEHSEGLSAGYREIG